MEQHQIEASLYESRLNPEHIIEKPPVLMSVVEQSATQTITTPIFSLGDISLIQGMQKAKKTFFTSLLAVSFLKNNVDKLRSYTDDDYRMCYFDTEQSNFFAQTTNQRIYHTARCDGPDEYDYFALRHFSHSERRQLIEMYLQVTKNVKFMILDGIVDLVGDFNDLSECSETVQWLMTLTKKYNFHLCAVLHENKADGKARGHLGTMLAQKAETVIRLEKHSTDISRSTIKAQDTRGKQFTDFDIYIDSDGRAHLVEQDKVKQIFDEPF